MDMKARKVGPVKTERRDTMQIASQDVAMAATTQRNRLLTLITISTFIAGVIVCLIGVFLIRLSATGTTKFSQFGQTFESTNVGIAAVFIGVVMVILITMRILKVIERR